MTLTLVTGRPNAGKTGLLYAPIIEAASGQASPIVLLPSLPDARRSAREFADRGISGVRTAVLDRWIEELWSLHGDGRRIVKPAVREVLLARACAEERLGALATLSGSPGLVRLLSSLAERVPDIGQAKPRTPEDREVVAILERYARILAAEGLVELAYASVALGADPPDVGAPVAVNRFTDLSPAQESFLVGLASVVDAWIALPWEDGHPASEALTPLVERLSVCGEHRHVPSSEPRDELGQLEDALFRPEAPIMPTGAVALAEAAGGDLEAVMAVDLAAEHVRRGVPAGRIAIIFRDARSRVALVEAAAAQAGIEMQTDVALALAETPMGRALLALLDVATGRETSRERVLAYLSSPYSGVEAPVVERADVRWREARISGGHLLDEVARLPGCEKAVRLARTVAHGPLTTRNVNRWKHLFDTLLVAADSHRGLMHAQGAWDCAAHRTATGVLAPLVEGVVRPVGAGDAMTALARAVVSPGGPEREDAVVFTEVHRVRGRRFDVIVLGGLSSSEFSSEQPTPLGAEMLQRLGLVSGGDGRASERLLFYTAVTRPRKALCLVRQSSDASGRAVRPSVFWEEVLDLYRVPGASDPDAHPKGLPLTVRPLTACARDCIAYTAGRRAARAVAGRRPWRPARGVIESELVRSALGNMEEFSVSELEAYATCPYRWFYERAVRPREIDATFEAREAGSLAHGVLAAFYERWSSPDSPRRVVPESLPEARSVLESVLSEALEAGPAVLGLGEQLAADKVRRWTIDAIEDDALFLPGYTPVACEFAFGRAEGRPFEFGGIALRGRVDRIDKHDRSLVVTDYKTGASVPGHGSFETRGIMQLPVYLAAAAALLDGSADGAVFRSLSSRTARGFWREDRVSLLDCGSRVDAVDAEGLSRILEQAASRVAAAAEGVRAGDIAPVRGGCAACASCPARPVCREGAGA